MHLQLPESLNQFHIIILEFFVSIHQNKSGNEYVGCDDWYYHRKVVCWLKISKN